jgi:hypothetical protein
MSLQEDLKARTLALISQQMANWVVEIQRQINDRQASLVRSLDDLQETVAAYDEKISEPEIEAAIAEVLAHQPPPPAPPPVVAGPGFNRLKASLAEVDKGSSLSEVLTYLVNEVSHYVDRAAMFIVKGPSAIGWYARGVEPPEAVKQVNISLNADTVFRNVHNSRHALRGSAAHTPGTAQALARIGGNPQGILAVPLMLRDKLAAILYCDTDKEEIPAGDADLIEILVQFAGKSIDLISVAPKTGTASSGVSRDRAAAIKAGGEEVRERAGVPTSRPVAAPPPPPAAASHPPAGAEQASSTVMFNASQVAALRAQPPPAARPAAPPAPPPGPALSPEEQKAHEDAKRFARLVVSEIKLYNEAKVNEGRRQKDIYERLKEDIERGRQMYTDRVAAPVREATNYFYDELVRILAGGDAGALGPM